MALGLDVGSKTIGVAVTDEAGVCAHAVTTLSRRGTIRDVETVRALVAKYSIEQVVVGMPYELDGSEGRRAERVRVFYEALCATGLRAELWDERYSSADAEVALLEANVSRARRKELIDKLAARVILQSWLDAHQK